MGNLFDGFVYGMADQLIRCVVYYVGEFDCLFVGLCIIVCCFYVHVVVGGVSWSIGGWLHEHVGEFWVVTISWVSGWAVDDLMGWWVDESYRRSIDGSVCLWVGHCVYVGAWVSVCFLGMT